MEQVTVAGILPSSSFQQEEVEELAGTAPKATVAQPASPPRSSAAAKGRRPRTWKMTTWIIPALGLVTVAWFIGEESWQLQQGRPPDHGPATWYPPHDPVALPATLSSNDSLLSVSSSTSSTVTSSPQKKLYDSDPMTPPTPRPSAVSPTSTPNKAHSSVSSAPAVTLHQFSPPFNNITTTIMMHDDTTVHPPPHPNSPYAYAFVMGGCHPDLPDQYRPYLYNMLVATQILRQQGSKQDVLALVQISWAAENYTTLPEEPDLRVLRALNIRVYYIPKQPYESFYRTQMDKFRILVLTQYRRILYMDGDVMPGGNLDYLFELSERGVIQENLVIQGKYEPANGGFFMLQPGYLTDIQKVIEKREENARRQAWPHFDPVEGWGHVIQPPDHWYAYRVARGTNWTFLAAFADQGLLYHYVKYVRGRVTIFMRRSYIQNWSRHPNGTVFLESESTYNPFANYSKTLKCWGLECFCGPPINDFTHFTGRRKPWLAGPPPEMLAVNATYDPLASPSHYWFSHLMKLNTLLNMSLDFHHWVQDQRPSLGLVPSRDEVLVASTNLLTPLTPAWINSIV